MTMTQTRDEERAASEHRSRFGAAGWTTTSGTADLLAPFMDPGALPGFARFSALDEPTCAFLLNTLPQANLEDHQNLGPSCGEILRAGVAHPGQVRPHGYLVSPPRWDERVGLDALVVLDPPEGWDTDPSLSPGIESRTVLGTGRNAVWQTIRAHLCLEEETAEPDELIRMLPAGCGGRLAWWLWWD